MSAALKDGIKSAMSGVGVALSGDMLSKCEFRGLLLYLSTKIESKISPNSLVLEDVPHPPPRNRGRTMAILNVGGTRRYTSLSSLWAFAAKQKSLTCCVLWAVLRRLYLCVHYRAHLVLALAPLNLFI